MKTETTKAMQEALEAAVVRMSNGNGATANHAAPPPTDLMGVLMSILPKLLQNNEANEESFEKLQEKIEQKIDSLQKGDVTALREQVLILRKQCHRLHAGQVELLAAIQEIQKQQVAANAAILDIAHHLSRMEVVAGPSSPDDEPGYESEAAPLPGSHARSGGANNDQRRARQKAAKNLNRARS